jgi:hypothetical protein
MAEFKIRTPDGRLVTVSGATREGAVAFLAQKERGSAPIVNTSKAPPLVNTSNAAPVVAPNSGNPDASRWQFALDQAQKLAGKGMESFGRVTGLDGIEGAGTYLYDNNVQEIKDRNYQSQNQGSFLDQKGIADKAAWTGEKIIENSVTGGVGLVGAGLTAVAAFFSAPLWVTASIGGLAVGSSTILGTGEVASELEEKTGSYDPKLALGGGFVIGLLDRLGATSVIPKDQLMKMTGKEVIDNLVAKGYIKMARDFAAGITKKASIEGATETLQEGVSIGTAASQGGEYTTSEIINRGVDGFVLGAGQGGVVATATDSISNAASIAKLASNGAFQDIRDLTDQQTQASGDVARQLQQIAQSEGFNLKNVDVSAQFGAKGALESLRETNNGEITSLAQILKSQMSPKNANSLDELLQVFAPVSAALKAGKNKVSGYVTIAQMKALGKVVGAGPEGQELMNALAKSNIITGLFKDGMKGGVSQFTDYFSPFGTSGAVYDPTRLGNIMIGGGLAGATMGTSVPIQAGVVTLGRLIDRATGRRSNINRFIKKNKDGTGLPAPSGLSMLDKAKLASEQSKARTDALAKISESLNAPPKDNSPVGTILTGTGLDRGGLSQVITQMATEYAGSPEVLDVLDSIQNNMEGGKGSVLELNEIIPIIGQYAQMTSPELLVATPDNLLLARNAPTALAPQAVEQAPTVDLSPALDPQVSTEAPAQPVINQVNGNLTTSQANYDAGKKANQETAETLQSQVMATLDLESRKPPSVPGDAASSAQTVEMFEAEARLLYEALEMVKTENVPIQAMEETAQALVNQGVSQENVDKFYRPYVDRVIRQQARKPSMLAQAQATQEAMSDTVPNVDTSSAVAPSVLEQAQALQQPSMNQRLSESLARLQETDARRTGGPDPLVAPVLTAQAQEGQAPKIKTSPLTQAQAAMTPVVNQTPLEQAQVAQDITPVDTNALTPEAEEFGNRLRQIQKDADARDAEGSRIRKLRENSDAAYNTVLNVISLTEKGGSVRDDELGVGLNKYERYLLTNRLRSDKILGPGDGNGFHDVLVDLEGAKLPPGPGLSSAKSTGPKFAGDESLSIPEMTTEPRQFGEKTDVSLETSLSNAFQAAQTKMYTKGRDFKLDLQAQSLAAQEREGIDLNTLDDANIDRLADFAVVDALEALKDNENAIGWYGRTVTAALNSVAELHPEVLTDPKAKMQFIWATAVTSNGLKVDKNMDLALDVYETIKTTGRMPTDMGIGKAAKAINQGLQKYHTMLEKFQRMSNTDEGAHALLDEFMNGKFPLKELQKEYGVKISGESANTLIRGSAILGPKIGGGFYSNLYGNFDELTMDRWLMRSVGRWRGGLVKINKPMIVKKTKEIQSLLETADLKALKPLFKKSGVFPRKKMSKDMVHLFSEVIAKESMDPAWREQINAIPGGEKLRKSGNGLAGYLDGQVEMPAGPKERDFIRSVFTKALDRLQNAPEIRNISNEPLNMSDLQALLWYPEKRLYDTAKQKDGESRGYKDDEAPDYANAAKTSVGNRLGYPGAAGYGGRGPSATNEGPTSDNSIQSPALLSPQVGPAGPRPAAAAPKRRPFAKVDLSGVRQLLPRSRAVFEIGRKGSKFEDGIQTLDDALDLAQALGIAVKLFDSQSEMSAYRGGASPNSMGTYTRSGNVGAEGTIFGLNPNAMTNSGARVSSISSLVTLLHEIGHGITLSPLDLSSPQQSDSNFVNPVTGEMDRAPRGSFAGSALRPLLEGTGDPAILKEIDNLQNNIEAYTTKDPKQRVAVRQVRKLMSDLQVWVDNLNNSVDTNVITPEQGQAEMDEMGDELSDFSNYTRNVRELSADPMAIYTLNPKLAKAVMPKTAALIKNEMRKGGNKTVQFYAHPLPVIIATVMAMLAQGKAEDEEKEGTHQMPDGSTMKNSEMGDGALTPPGMPAGLLTAA